MIYHSFWYLTELINQLDMHVLAYISINNHEIYGRQ